MKHDTMRGGNIWRPQARRPGAAFALTACFLIASGVGGSVLTTSARRTTTPLRPRPVSRSAHSNASRCRSRAVQARADVLTKTAKRRYDHEQYGVAVHAALRRVTHDGALLRALNAGAPRTARAEAKRQLIFHTVRIRIVRGSRVLVDANPASFAVAGPTGELHGPHGRVLGQAQVTVQDVVGFIKLVHRYHPAHLLVRGRHGHVQTSLPASRTKLLPASGCTTVAGHAYAVRSFTRTGFAGEPLKIWLLV
jgi:hypothetical protein